MLRQISGIIFVALLMLAAPVHASQYEGGDRRMQAAIDRVMTGEWTRADLQYIKSEPAIAAQVPDPRATEWGDSSGRLTAKSNGSCGHWYLAWFKKKSLLGFTLYNYYQRAFYCKTSTKITKWQSRKDYWTDPTSVAYWKKLVRNEKRGIGTSKAVTTKMRHIELCVVKYGCYASLYPTITLVIRPDSDDNEYFGNAG